MVINKEFATAEGNFRITLSRDIRTPLNGIMGMVSLLLDSGLNAEQRNYATVIARSADNLLLRLDDMVAAPGADGNDPGPSMAPADLSGLRVLVIAGDDAAAKITEHQLLTRDMMVDTVTSRPEALETLISAARNLFAFDMVVVDHTGTGASVFRLARKIRDNQDIGDIPLIMISDIIPAKIKTSGFDGALSKPVGSTEIIDLISTLRSARQQGQPLPFMTRVQLRQYNRHRRDPSKAEINYAGIKVLLAEDSRVNRMVAGKILDNYGFMVTIATTGREAVALVRKQSFDIILMDCQMPEMDGYEATKMIVDYQQGAGVKATPIIAFTANVMTGDDEKCLAAGMDDYISKPVQPENMIDIMSRWLTVTVAEKAQKAKISRDKKKLVEPDILAALRALTGEKFIAVLTNYISSTGNIIIAMDKAIRSKDAVTLRRESHSLKSTSLQIGATMLGKMASELEKMSLTAGFGEIAELFPAVSKRAAQVVLYLKNYIAIIPGRG